MSGNFKLSLILSTTKTLIRNSSPVWLCREICSDSVLRVWLDPLTPENPRLTCDDFSWEINFLRFLSMKEIVEPSSINALQISVSSSHFTLTGIILRRLFLARKCGYVFKTGKGSFEICQDAQASEGMASGGFFFNPPPFALKNELILMVQFVFLLE